MEISISGSAIWGRNIYSCIHYTCVDIWFTLMTTEIAIGRKTKLSPTRAYSKVDKNLDL